MREEKATSGLDSNAGAEREPVPTSVRSEDSLLSRSARETDRWGDGDGNMGSGAIGGAKVSPVLRSLLLLRWFSIVAGIGVLTGSASALFLWSLHHATVLQWENPLLLLGLPVGGMLVAWIYMRWGASAEAGNNLVLDEIHAPEKGVPLRMAPLILVGTVITHLFGGSAGREGTAVQMGASIASVFQKWIRLSVDARRILILSGVAAGFGAVFGTPIAGAIFALEVAVVGQLRYSALIPCLFASVLGDWTCRAWGLEHTPYRIGYLTTSEPPANFFHLNLPLLCKVILASIAFGWVSRFFSELSHGLNACFRKWVRNPLWRPVVGGVLVIGLTYLLGTRAYLGLGVESPDPNHPSIVRFFDADMQHSWSWWWKIVFTAVTLSAGFKGGEVTPLFFIGAGLGHALAGPLGAPVDLMAALGFVAVFAGASNTPLACTIMAIELFGATHSVYFAGACAIAYVVSGHSGIYLSQRIATPKHTFYESPKDVSLREIRGRKIGGDGVPPS